MKLRNLILSASLAAGVALGAASQASANAGAYLFGYTYAPWNAGFNTQQLILNGGATTLQATSMGWYDYTGSHSAANQDFIVGDCSIGTCGGVGAYNDFFVFDLSGVSGPITSAQLSLGNPGSPYPGYSGVPSSTYTNFDVSTPISTLIADASGATGIYADLGSGVIYAATGVSAADNATQVMVTLNANALASLNTSEGGQWAVGGTLGKFTAPGVPEPATWGMMIVGFGMIGGTLRRRRQAVAI